MFSVPLKFYIWTVSIQFLTMLENRQNWSHISRRIDFYFSFSVRSNIFICVNCAQSFPYGKSKWFLVSISLFLVLFCIHSLYTRTLNIIIGWLSKTFQKFLDYLIIVAMISPPPSPQTGAAVAAKKYIAETSGPKVKRCTLIILLPLLTHFFVVFSLISVKCILMI